MPSRDAAGGLDVEHHEYLCAKRIPGILLPLRQFPVAGRVLGETAVGDESFCDKPQQRGRELAVHLHGGLRQGRHSHCASAVFQDAEGTFDEHMTLKCRD